MELCESEVLRIDDDDRIRPEKIHTIFDDRGREEDVIISLLESVYSIFDLFTWHLSMGDYDS